MKKLLIYLDPSYQSNIGHYNRLSNNIHTFINEQSNIDILHYVNKSVNDLPNKNMINHFEYSAFINYDQNDDRKIKNILNSFEKDIADIFIHIKNIEKNYSSIILYMYTASIEHINIILNQSNINKKLFIHTVLFYLDKNFTRGKVQDTYINKVTLLNDSINNANNPNFCLYLDSNKAIELYQEYFDIKLLVNAIPLYKSSKTTKENIILHKPITISYFGYQSFFHGFHTFYLLYKKLKDDKRFNFIVRANKLIYNKELETRINEIKNNPKVKFYEDYLEDELYSNIFKHSDIIVIPYMKNCYPVQTSGVFIETVFEDKYVIVAKDTWMDYYINKMNNGISFNSVKNESITDSFFLLIKKIKLENKNLIEIEKFKSFYTVKNLFKQIGLLNYEQ